MPVALGHASDGTVLECRSRGLKMPTRPARERDRARPTRVILRSLTIDAVGRPYVEKVLLKLSPLPA